MCLLHMRHQVAMSLHSYTSAGKFLFQIWEYSFLGLMEYIWTHYYSVTA